MAAVAVSGALLVALAGCASPKTEGATAEGALDRFYSQDLTWEECGDYAVTALDEKYFPLSPESECARLEVPLAYSDPRGETASVAVVRIAARGESMGSLLYNPGGPGVAGLLTTIAASVTMAESAITERFDLIGFDPRGVGATKPAVDCYSEDNQTAGDEVFERLGTVAPALTEADTRALVERCAEGSGGMEALANVGSRTTAHDMDVLREALGEDKLNFLGQSYGSRLGTVYAEEFPENVRAMILDGAFDPTMPLQDRLPASYSGFQATFDAMAASCATQQDCPLGTDPAGWTAAFQAIVQPLGKSPVPALDAELNFETALGGVMGGLYSPDSWPRIVAGLQEVQQGRGDQLLELANGVGGFEVEADTSDGSLEALMAINCVDETMLSSGDLAQLRADAYEQAPFMDPGTDVTKEARYQCADWPATGELNIPIAQDIEGLPATLVVSITGDPTTPHSNGVSLADSLGSTLLTVEGEGHTVVSSGGSPCVDEIAAAYLIDLELPVGELSCAL
ncbi:alpha/beta hydrolase [Pengzhenrongella sicca]|uniref:Alpha/beta fold hydrolase n=1 Tax=Pengzhenrongella sicca TaxID=2819238 RepID=A0A8A4ZGN7_9MICO|nr:alpha/beta hydrolase [Pengzhenrongella sicca]QTE31054.1 alpha/beta fold hydrolase [Pengzhenrongella sicca]